MQELQFQVVIDKSLDSDVKGVVAFGDFESSDGSAAIYPVDGIEAFFNDLILGKPFPLVFATRRLETLGTFVAVSLFLHRDLALHPGVPGVVAAVRLFDVYKVSGLAHVDRDLARFFRFLTAYLNTPPQDKAAQQQALATAVGWLRAYVLEGRLPSMPAERELPRILDRGTDGFVVASCSHSDLVLGWEELYRQGFLRGILMQSVGRDRWRMLGARKSAYLAFDVVKAAAVLNEAEGAMGEPPQWYSDGLWLVGPEEGTLLLPSAVIRLLLMV